MKRVLVWMLAGIALLSCVIVANFSAFESQAAENRWLYLDAGKGTFYITSDGSDCFSAQWPFAEGSTLASNGMTIEDPTCAGMTFQGWLGFNADTGAALEGGKVFTTQEVNSYVIPAHGVRFEAQWSGTPITAITYAALYNKTGEVDYNVRVTLINNGVSYSGMGFVTIPESVYSQWTGTVQQIWEFPGEYINANNTYIADYFDAGEGTVRSFIKEKSCYHTIYKASGEKEILPKRTVVNQVLTYASTVMPEISKAVTGSAGSMISETDIVPSDYTVTTNLYESGATYDKAAAAAQQKYGSSNVLVYNIDLQDPNGQQVHKLSGTVSVKLSVPAGFSPAAGKAVVVYYLTDDGSLEPCETVYDAAGGTVTFKTDHFSVYVVAEVDPAAQEPETEPESSQADTGNEDQSGEGEKEPGNGLFYVLLGAGMILLAVIGWFVFKKRK